MFYTLANERKDMNQYSVVQESFRTFSKAESTRPFLIEIKNRAGQFFYYGLFATAFDAHLNAIDHVELPAKIYVKALKRSIDKEELSV